MNVVKDMSLELGVRKSCRDLGVSRSNYYYWLKVHRETNVSQRNLPDFTYSPRQREMILQILNSEPHMNQTPYQVYASLLDEGKYICSVRTMYRILAENDQLVERRSIRPSHNFVKPELLATRPNDVWSWDITKLKAQEKWTYFYLYVIIDIFSRFVVGWMVAYRESSALAKHLIEETCRRQKIQEGQLTIHADRGSSMKSKPVAFLLSDLGITKTHSRPYNSNDNPYSESHFKTVKYHPIFPGRFHSMTECRNFCTNFFEWYNLKHYHSGIGFLTPESIHYGFAQEILDNRYKVLLDAYYQNPKRFRFKKPKEKVVHQSVWINKPDNFDNKEKTSTQLLTRKVSKCP